MTTRPFQLQSIDIGDDPDSWAAAGFTINDDLVTVANTVIRLVGTHGERGIVAATLAGIDADVDGLRFTGSHRADAAAAPEHANQVTELDHLVAMSPDMDRTTAALVSVGLDHRRTRRFEAGATTRRQEFFWLGDVILELAGDDVDHGPGPAVLWGLALTCADIDTAAAHLGAALGEVKPAVQTGRRIATVRSRELRISVPLALMSPHPSQPDGA